ncbi:DUF1269 domain-containing protein [Cryobacterium arcticum]|uniref:DUF1269 domain-containing protein n=1 Tax=Cryobacterium arcticum TaxID=670052 RepID=A0A317ZMZ4_9MICO|nr:DUF1269 domain-containing protein [Cryobacterium arcticum]PXA67892.1 hypothetical protein CTB96_14580 [Cryobacterium arcticum]
MSDDPVFLYLGVYSDAATAESDLDVVRDLHARKVIGTYDAAVAIKEADGTVQVRRKTSTHTGWTGVAAGAVVGLLFPPSIIGTAIVGGAAGGVIGHFWRGLDRKDVKELGEMLDSGEAALIVVGKDKLEDELAKAGLVAQKHLQKELKMDAKQLDKELAQASKDMQNQARTDTY